MKEQIKINLDGIRSAYYVKRQSWYCGYVELEEDHPLCKVYDESSYTSDFASKLYQPHGGVTYAERNKDGRLVLGFDFNHYGDDKSGINDIPNYVMAETIYFAEELSKIYKPRKAMKQIGTINVDCTLSFKGSVDATLWNDMTMAEVIHDIIHSGDYEYEVIQGSMNIDNIQD